MRRVRKSIAEYFCIQRKVRTAWDSIVANDHTGQPDDQSNSDVSD